MSFEHIRKDIKIADPQTKALLPKAFDGHLERMGIIDKALLLYYGMLIKILTSRNSVKVKFLIY